MHQTYGTQRPRGRKRRVAATLTQIVKMASSSDADCTAPLKGLTAFGFLQRSQNRPFALFSAYLCSYDAQETHKDDKEVNNLLRIAFNVEDERVGDVGGEVL